MALRQICSPHDGSGALAMVSRQLARYALLVAPRRPRSPRDGTGFPAGVSHQLAPGSVPLAGHRTTSHARRERLGARRQMPCAPDVAPRRRLCRAGGADLAGRHAAPGATSAPRPQRLLRFSAVRRDTGPAPPGPHPVGCGESATCPSPVGHQRCGTGRHFAHRRTADTTPRPGRHRVSGATPIRVTAEATPSTAPSPLTPWATRTHPRSTRTTAPAVPPDARGWSASARPLPSASGGRRGRRGPRPRGRG